MEDRKYNEAITEELATNVKNVLSHIGEDVNQKKLLKTPKQIPKTLQFLTNRYNQRLNRYEARDSFSEFL